MRPILYRSLKVLAVLALMGLLLVSSLIAAVYFGAFGKVYSEQELASFENQYGSAVLSAEGKTLGYIFKTHRTEAEFSDLPNDLVDALLATEDVRFFNHAGVDIRSLFRVAVRTLILGDRSGGGGSTITQQLAKNMFGRSDHGFLTIPVNKLREMILAYRLEQAFTKRQILTKYLNTVSFGEDVYGIEQAGQRYFNKPIAELQTQEAATLVGMLKATTTYNPRRYPENALSRRNVVLSQMNKYGYLDDQAYHSIRAKPLGLNYHRQMDAGKTGYLIAQVRKAARQLLDSVAASNAGISWSLEEDGLTIETTINYQLQLHAAQAMEEQLRKMQPLLARQYLSGRYRNELDSMVRSKLQVLGVTNDSATFRNVFSWEKAEKMTFADSIRSTLLQLHSGTLAMDPATGAVLAYVGGIDFATNPYDQVQAKRQLASTFKPVLYAAALSHGKAPCDYIANEPFVLTDFEDWRPSNYNEEVGGKYSLAAALAYSKNIPAVRLLFETGFEKVAQTWKALGFIESLHENPSLALGAIEASLAELVSGYSAFANKGVRSEPFIIQKITSREGKVLYQHETKPPVRALDDQVAEEVTMILSKAVNEGTGVSLRKTHGLELALAGKTGTSQNFADAWFIGYNSAIIIASRVGASRPNVHFASGAQGAGSVLALPIVGMTLQRTASDPEGQWLSNGRLAITSASIDCPDFKEETGLEKILKVFKSEKTTLEKEQKKANKKGFFKRIFGKKSKEE